MYFHVYNFQTSTALARMRAWTSGVESKCEETSHSESPQPLLRAPVGNSESAKSLAGEGGEVPRFGTYGRSTGTWSGYLGLLITASCV